MTKAYFKEGRDTGNKENIHWREDVDQKEVGNVREKVTRWVSISEEDVGDLVL